MKKTLCALIALLALSASAQEIFRLQIIRMADTNSFRLYFGCPPAFASSLDVGVFDSVTSTVPLVVLSPHPLQVNSPVRTYDFIGFNPTNLFFRFVGRK